MAIFRWGPEISAFKHLAPVDAVHLEEMLQNKSWEINETGRKINKHAQEMNETRWKELK